MEHSAFSTLPTGSEPASAQILADTGLGDRTNPRRNVLVMLPSAMVGGAERVAYNLVTALLADGHKVCVYTMTRGLGPLWPGLRGHDGFTHIASNAHSEKRGVIDFLTRRGQFRAMGPFDLVYTSHVHVNALASVAIRLGFISTDRFVSRESTRIFDRFKGMQSWIYRLAYRCYGAQDVLIFQTEEMQQSLNQAIGLPKKIMQKVVPNPVNLASVDAALANSIEPNPNGQATFRIVFCGRLIPLKQIDLLLAALAQLDPKRDWQLDVLGNGPLRQDLSLQAEKLGIAQRVHFHGNVDNPYAFFAYADLGVLCSKIEGFPNVLLEMMASGTKAIISTPCTPAISALHGLTILHEQAPDILVAQIARAMDYRPDNSAFYRRHVEQAHSIGGFIQTVLGEETVQGT